MCSLKPNSLRTRVPPSRRTGRARRAGEHGGFTLIEVLAALLLVGIALPVIMQGFSVVTRVGSAAKRRTEAAALADAKLTELVATSQWQTGVQSGDFSPDWPAYQWSAQIQPWSDSGVDELDLTVTWTGRNGQPDSLTLSTLVYEGTSSDSTTSGTGTTGTGTGTAGSTR
jgi:general secretion pathway protein I